MSPSPRIPFPPPKGRSRIPRSAVATLVMIPLLWGCSEGDVVSKFVEKRGIAAPIYLPEGNRPGQFKSRGIQATFVLDQSGMFALRQFGAANWSDESVVNFVRGLAATPTQR